MTPDRRRIAARPATPIPESEHPMKTVLYPAFDELTIADQPEPQIAPHEVLIEVAACGVCGSELDSFRARSPRRPPPLIMGHEYCGRIAAVGSAVSGWREGQKVVGNSVVPCGDCVRCRRGDTHLCAKRQVFGMHPREPVAGVVSVSIWIVSIGRPSTPPFSLNSSIAIIMPRRSDAPELAYCPLASEVMPITIGSAASAVPAKLVKAAIAAPDKSRFLILRSFLPVMDTVHERSLR
jgi:hypothetical protein